MLQHNFALTFAIGVSNVCSVSEMEDRSGVGEMIAVLMYSDMTVKGPVSRNDYRAVGLLRLSGEQETNQGNALVQLI